MLRIFLIFINLFLCLSFLIAQNVGISNDATFTTPQSPLHIYWTSDGNLLQLSRSNLSNSGLVFSVSSNDYSIFNRHDNALIFGTNALERMRITNSGNIGIGTSSPTAQLHTTGTIRFANYASGANGAILRTNNIGNLSVTNFSGVANEVLLGTGSFGSMNNLAWQLTGNSGTNPTTNFIGTTDAQDLVIRSNNQERIRVLSGGSVRIGYGTDASDALQVGGYGSTNPTVFIGSTGGGAPGYGSIRLYGTSYGTDAIHLRGGGLTYFNTGNQYVFGRNTVVDANDLFAVQASATYPWAINAYTNQNNAGAIYAQATGIPSYGVWGETNDNTSIGVVGSNSSTTANNLARGVQGQTTNPAGRGVVGINSSTTANTSAIGVLGYTTNSSGTAVYGYVNNTTADVNATGVFGVTNNSSGIGVLGFNSSTTSDENACGVWGETPNPNGDAGYFVHSAAAGTNNGNGIWSITSQRSGFGVRADNLNTNGTGLVAVGNNIVPTYLTTGTGASIGGSNIGLFAYKNGALASNAGAALFLASSTGNVGVYVAYRTGGTNYKIINVGTFGGQVSTDVWGLTNDTNDRKIMFAPEAPEIVFHDFGTSKLENGRAYIKLDPIFSRNIVVNDEHPLRVFIQLEGNCNGVFVTNKTKEGFEVVELNNGTSNTPFSWFVIANRADYVNPITGVLISKHEGVRFPQAPNPLETVIVKDKIRPSRTNKNIDVDIIKPLKNTK